MVMTGTALFIGNSASINSGGVVVIGGIFNVTGTVKLTKNSAVVFGGDSCEMFVTGHVLLADNSAKAFVRSQGGGMVVRTQSNLTVTGTMSLINNSAVSGHGGGMAFMNKSQLVIL